jgi:L-glyceraldehyde 3-phosphate reductase
LLSDKYLRGIPESSRAGKAHGFLRPAQVTPEKIAQAEALNKIAVARGQTLPQLALAWVLRQPQMTSVLIGASSVPQLEENLKTVERLALSEDELDSIEKILKA